LTLQLERLLDNDDSFDFFKQLVDNKKTYLDLEEDYRDLHEFFTTQLQIWQELQAALTRFKTNAQALEKNQTAMTALKQLEQIESSDSPYGQLQNVTSLISTVDTVNTEIVKEKRDHAIERVEQKINQIQTEIDKSSVASADLSNRMLMPLQKIKASLETEGAISTIYMLQAKQASDAFDDALAELQTAEQAAASQAKDDAKKTQQSEGEKSAAGEEHAPYQPQPKVAVDISISDQLRKAGIGIYIETETEAESFLKALRDDLMKAIEDNKRIRLR
jgi:phage gp36-like protein